MLWTQNNISYLVSLWYR